MATSDEIVLNFKDELHRALTADRQSLRERIAAFRAQLVERMNQLESEVDATASPLTEQLEQQLLHTFDPLLSFPAQMDQQQAALNDQIAKLGEALSQHEKEKTGLLLEIGQLTEQISRLSQDLAEKDEVVGRLIQERQQLDEHAAHIGEEYAQERANLAETTRALLQRLLASLDQIEGKKSQVDILTAFLDEAAEFSARVALFVAKGELFSGWRSRGFSSESFADQDIKTVHFSMESESILRQAYEERLAIQGGLLSHRENSLVLQRLGSPLKDSFVAIPLVVKGKSTAVLYADGGTTAEGTYDIEALELLVRLVALSIELLAYRARVVAPARHEPRVEVPPGQKEAAPALTEARPAMASVFLPVPTMDHPVAPPPAQVERAPEPIRPSTVGPRPPEEAAAVVPGSDQELKLHNDAKRFARLLVSEIKLYNEQKVVAGRKNRDLYDRLKEDIDRSREMYMKRVSPIVSSKVDYFHDELVRTLGENDPGALGSDCPGPMTGVAAE